LTKVGGGGGGENKQIKKRKIILVNGPRKPLQTEQKAERKEDLHKKILQNRQRGVRVEKEPSDVPITTNNERSPRKSLKRAPSYERIQTKQNLLGR